MYDNPIACCDVSVPENGIDHIIRVAIFGDLDEKWMADWRESFYGLTSLQEHCEYIAFMHHAQLNAGFFEGYGPAVFVEHNWRMVTILDADGNEVGFALVKLQDASGLSDKVDVIKSSEVKWNGIKNTN